MHSFEEDNELDHVAQKAAEAFDAPGRANWDKMQLLLDKEMPITKPKKRFFWVLIPALLLLVMGGLWWYNKTDQSITVNKTLSQPAPVQIPTTIEHTRTLEPSKTATTAIHKNEKIRLVNSKGTNANKTSEFSSSLLTQMGIAKGPIDQVFANENKPVSLKTNNLNEPDSTKQHPLEELTQHSVEVNAPVSSNETLPASNKTNALKSEENAKTIVLKNKDNNEKGFFIGLTAGIDASTVKFNYKQDLGYNIGGLIGYRFNQHFSIKTGGIYTQKNYKMNGVDFHAPKGTWVSYFKMETVTGTCDMWDIPLIGTYHFKYNGKGNYFASLGTSSYFMKKENYSYLYYVNNQTYNRTASYPSTDQHLFALIHISGGIEKPIGKRLTGIIEPYAKIPLSGVGFGNIELSSFGVNFSLTFKQPKRK